MRGNSHVRFGGRAEETDPPKGRHRASARSNDFYASLLIAHGESVKVVQARLGHASASETLDTYAHLWPDNEERTRAAVDGVLGANPPNSTQPIERSQVP
jgi:integrase